MGEFVKPGRTAVAGGGRGPVSGFPAGAHGVGVVEADRVEARVEGGGQPGGAEAGGG